MRTPTRDVIQSFLEELGRRCDYPAEIYIFGGSALILLGSSRFTIDVDYTLGAPTSNID